MQKTFSPSLDLFRSQWAFDKFCHDILVERMEGCGLNDTPVMLIMELLNLYQPGKVSLVDLQQ